MRVVFIFINILVILAVSSSSYASDHYLKKNRVVYISNVMRAFSETQIHDIINMYSYISVVDRNNCRSSLSDLRVECLLGYAKKSCKEAGNAESVDNCKLYSDIIVVNKLSENTFVNKSERYRMLKNTNDDYKTVMARRLQQKYAKIVTHFSLSEGSDCGNDEFQCLARKLDQFCLEYTNTHSLSWQYCTSASLWFIGTSDKD